MATEDFEAFVAAAMFLDRDDPVAAWGELRRRAGGADRVHGGREEIRIEADGTDLTLSVAGRTWINSDGRRNMPSGEIFTGPVEDSRRGHDPLRRARLPARPRGRRHRARVRRAGGRRARRRAATTTPLDARPTTAPAGSASWGSARTPASTASPAHPVRREDRRHRPPGARAGLPRDRRHQRVGDALGPDLRPAPRRADDRRRRARRRGRSAHVTSRTAWPSAAATRGEVVGAGRDLDAGEPGRRLVRKVVERDEAPAARRLDGQHLVGVALGVVAGLHPLAPPALADRRAARRAADGGERRPGVDEGDRGMAPERAADGVACGRRREPERVRGDDPRHGREPTRSNRRIARRRR